MSARHAAWATALAAAGLISGACGLGNREALEQRVVGAEARLERAGAVQAMLDVDVATVKSAKPTVPGPPKILPANVSQVPTVIDLHSGRAAVGVRDGDATTGVLVFVGTDLYQRIAPKTQSTGAPALTGAATNLQALVSAYHGITLNQAAADQPATTTTTTSPSALRRAARIPRQWIGFDYGAIDEKDPTKKAGSYAINPGDVLRLVRGTLTGSIERHVDPKTGFERYDANVSRDKAERKLSEDDRKLLDKVFRANAIGGRTYPAHIWLDREGNLRRFEVKLRQSLTNVDRADLRVRIEVTGPATRSEIARPDPKATATVTSLGQLVTAVSGA